MGMTKDKFELNYPKLLPTRIADDDSFIEDIPNFGEGTDGSAGNYFAINCGFPLAYAKPFDKDGQPINRAEFNSVLNVLSQLHWYWQYGGRPIWDERVLKEAYMGSADMTGYPAGVKVVHEGKEYLSLKDNNFKTPGAFGSEEWWSAATDPGTITGDIDTFKREITTLVYDTKTNLEATVSSLNRSLSTRINDLDSRVVVLSADTNVRINDLADTVEYCYQTLFAVSGQIAGDIGSLKEYTDAVSGQIESTMTDGFLTLNAAKLDRTLLMNPGLANVTGYVADAFETRKFVNSSINALAAYYITCDAAGNAFATVSALKNASVYYNGGKKRVPTMNDYAIVMEDEDHVEYGIHPTTRYVFDGKQWDFQYVVNNTPLTQAQVDVLNSGITSSVLSTLRYAISANTAAILDLSNSTISADNMLSGYTTDVKNTLTSSLQAGLSSVNGRIDALSGVTSGMGTEITTNLSALSASTVSNFYELNLAVGELSSSIGTLSAAVQDLLQRFPDYSATPVQVSTGYKPDQNGFIEVLNSEGDANTSIFPINKGDTLELVGSVNARFIPTQAV